MMIPNPTRFTKIVRKMMRSGRDTSVSTFYTMRRYESACSGRGLRSGRHGRPLHARAARGPGARAAAPALFAADGKVPSNGPLGATIPAVMDAMAIALETKGTLRLEQVMAPAIELADGFPMYQFLRDFFVSERKATEQYEWSAKTYYPGGRVPDVGEMFRQPNLARTLRAIVNAEKANFATAHDRV